MRSERGYTLIEVTLVVALLAALFTTLALAQVFTLGRADATRDKEEAMASAALVLREIQESLRLSTEILQAGTDVLTLESRYFVDRDDGVEKIRYTRSGDRLLREIANPSSAAYGSPEVLLEQVAAFAGETVRIEDDFPRVKYDALVIPIGSELLTYPGNDATYSLTDMGEIDPDVLSSYNSELERLEIGDSAGSKTATVSPDLEKEGLEAVVSFTPLAAGKKYYPLVFGAESVTSGSVAIVFDSGGTIHIQRHEGGAVVAQETFTGTWGEFDPYQIKLELAGSKATGWIDQGSGFEKIGAIETGTLDVQPMHLRSDTGGGLGAWDDLKIDYPYVGVTLSVTLDGQTETLHGGATSRNRP